MSGRDDTVVRVAGLSKAFDGNEVLRGVDLELRRGETVVVLGGSGSGKTVLLKHINGLLRPDRGEVVVLGCDIASLEEKDLVDLRRRVSYIFQQDALFDSLTVGENVGYPLREHEDATAGEIASRVGALLARVGWAGAEDLMPSQLSGGMRKRVALARGLALSPAVILYDEPTAGLDPLTGLSITRLIREVADDTGATSLVVTHDLTVARGLADRLVFLREGRFEFAGSFADALRAEGAVGEFVRAGGINV
jgi:phospholipid/cholesterol/gamma-HCH transport system ATP-binding protein